jgi:peptidoglycan/xylan/chitin deacetylase (PgdA/CDA1 family)
VLAYHAIRDLVGAAVVESYGVPPDSFRRQLDILREAGFQFISADEFLQFLHRGGGLPRKPLLLTFDDGYEELLNSVLPILQTRGIPAIVFVVSGRLGGTNEWDKTIGAPELRLLDVNGLRALAQGGLEIGAHSRTHPPLTHARDDELLAEISGSIADLEDVGFDRPRMFAYPEGDYDHRVQRTVKEANIEAAFTVVADRVRPGHDPYQIPRIEILREDTGWKFLWKVIMAGRFVWRRSVPAREVAVVQ